MQYIINNNDIHRETTITVKRDDDTILCISHGDKYIYYDDHLELYKNGELISIIFKWGEL